LRQERFARLRWKGLGLVGPEGGREKGREGRRAGGREGGRAGRSDGRAWLRRRACGRDEE
jgi:hypothetical protein